MDSDAKAYSALNKPQYDMGCEFVRSLNISEGDKVLDMGCGTGDVTNFIASLVGQHGDVVGVDPDKERIKIAQEKFKDVKNLKFFVGDSSSAFPHDNEEYYDRHFSSSAFHWLIGNEKKIYLKKAYQCLKPGRHLAILTSFNDKDVFNLVAKDLPIEFLTIDEHKQLFEEVDLFTNIELKTGIMEMNFESFQQYKAWVRASSHRDLDDYDPDSVKASQEKFTRTEVDGKIIVKIPTKLTITAEKRVGK